jgi:molybdopterin-guanine dinucleotide biosynthesis protein A
VRELAAIVLAGGGATRLGGVDKTGLVGPDGRTVLELAVAACRPAAPVVVVGPEATARAALPRSPDVLVTCERPAGSGPVRAVEAGLEALAAAGATADYVMLLAGDMPAAGPALAALRAAIAGRPQPVDGLVALAAGRRQWLTGVYAVRALQRARARVPPPDLFDPAGRGPSLGDLLGGLDLVGVAVPAASALDLDTWADVARAGFGRPPETTPTMKGLFMDELAVVDQWLEALRARLDLTGLETPDWVDLLAVVRETSHGVAHAAAPVAAFAAGYAAARAGGGRAAVTAALTGIRDELGARAAGPAA